MHAYNVHVVRVYLTITSRCSSTPHSISQTDPGHISSQSVAIITGVGSSHHEGGSRGCVHCSIGGVSEDITVNSYMYIVITEVRLTNYMSL